MPESREMYDQTHEFRPTQPNERIFAIDAVRGVAIFGILVVNMIYFAWPFHAEVVGIELWSSTADLIAETAIRFFAEGKFITMFSLLFGLGFSMLITRAEKRGARVAPLFVRRLLVLLLIGLVHTLFIWVHDVLVYFALTGFILLLFRNREPRTLLRWAALFLAVPIVVAIVLAALAAVAAASPEAAAQMEAGIAEQRAMFERLYEQAFATYSTGTFAEVTVQRLADFSLEFIGGFIGSNLFLIAAMFLLGTWFGRQAMFSDVEGNIDRWRRLFRTALPIGVIASLVYTWASLAAEPLDLSWPFALRTAGMFIGGPALSLTYVATIVLASRREHVRRLLQPVANVGRFALSNYLLQSVICTTLFYGYGFGLMGRVGPAVGLAITVAIYALQLLLSSLWVRRFRYGPAELLWRRLTYRAV